MINTPHCVDPTIPSSGSQFLQCIVADDEPSIGGFVARIIARVYPSVKTTVVPDGRAALLAYLQDGADLMIADINMPGMDGLALVRELRRQQAIIPVLLMSGQLDALPEEPTQSVATFLAKPFSAAQLVDALTQCMAVSC
jgi:DNA-binding NtrC family response regulator